MNRIVPSFVFALLALLTFKQLTQFWSSPPLELQALEITHAVLAIVFAGMMAVLFITRQPPVSEPPSLSARVIAIGGTFVTWFILIQPNTTDDLRVLAGADVLMIVGILLTTYALGVLGRSFGIAPEARELVTSGPYRWVRNPAYLAEFVTAIGMILPLLSPLTIAIFALFIALQLRRITLEERVLSASFPEYDDYRRRTPALIPLFLTNRLALSHLPR
jgi:protein-S-isoprenylcysteine O-methyltransferase Ste14